MKDEFIINKVETYEQILELLILYTNRFESLSKCKVNPAELANKYCKNATVLTGRMDKQYVGFCAFYHNDNVNKKAFISMIAVNSSFEGKGYASKLLCSMENMCKEDGMVEILLEVRPNNQKAIEFYTKHGYVMKNIKSQNDCYIMSKKLNIC